MPGPLTKAAVIGAGSMGAGIAAQFANAGVPVVLLDLPAVQGRRSARAEAGVRRQLERGGFMHRARAGLVRTGNIDDDLGLLADADWIVEAIVEDAEAKQALYRRLEAVRKEGAAVSSNTSTIPLARLTQGLPDRFAADFVITHFFNPPRAMQLVEMVVGPATQRETARRVWAAADQLLGKTVIPCRDTPGFIANRIGCYWMSAACLEAVALELPVEAADAICGAPFGVPSTGIFGLLDLVGIDLVPPVWNSLLGALPGTDPHRAYDLPGSPLIRGMVERGLIGRKAGGGFYRLVAQDGKRSRQALDLKSFQYRQAGRLPADRIPGGGKDLKLLCEDRSPLGRYAWRVLSRTVAYAAAVAPEIAEDVAAIDRAVSLGYAWKEGPFALADRVGAGFVAERLAAEGEAVPPLLEAAVRNGGFHGRRGRIVLGCDGTPRPVKPRPGLISLADVKASSRPVAESPVASLWDLGDGVACLEIHSKMNAIDEAVLAAIEAATERVPAGFKALVIGNEHPRAFSVGADLRHFSDLLRRQDWAAAAAFVERGQLALRGLAAAPFPVVSAAFGLALGGGCEILMHSDLVVAHGELNAGLPEVKVGILPGWGATTRLLLRCAARPGAPKGPVAAAQRAIDVLLAGQISGSALEAQDQELLRRSDRLVMNRERLLAVAKTRALELAEGYRPPPPVLFAAAGPSGRGGLMSGVWAMRHQGRLSDNDLAVAEAIATVLTGGDADPTVPLDDDALYRLEREALAELVRRPATLARMDHMLATGTPLKN